VKELSEGTKRATWKLMLNEFSDKANQTQHRDSFEWHGIAGQAIDSTGFPFFHMNRMEWWCLGSILFITFKRGQK
jgi:hypothetical protein